MKRVFFLLVWAATTYGDGVYGAAMTGYGYTRLSVNGRAHKARHISYEQFLGYGRFLQSLYIGVEAKVAHYGFSRERGGKRLELNTLVAGRTRVGKKLNDKVMVYAAVGFGRLFSTYKSPKKRLTPTLMDVGVGVEASWLEHVTLRSEIGALYGIAPRSHAAIPYKSLSHIDIKAGISLHI